VALVSDQDVRTYEMENINEYSGWGNEVLYRMCCDAPRHDDLDKIAGKIWLIGRSYSASIERKAGKKMIEGQDFYMTQVAPAIKRSDIDQWIDSVKDIQRVTDDNIHLVLSAHKNVTDLFSEITGVDKRSLASKYLHFHQPKAFFIFDSIASMKIRQRLRSVKPRFKIPKQYDYEYSAFVYRCIYYRDTIFEKEIGKSASPRLLDKYLLGY
jgi:hypothetical protein